MARKGANHGESFRVRDFPDQVSVDALFTLLRITAKPIRKLLLQSKGYRGGNERRDITAETAHFLDNAGTQESIVFLGSQKNCFQARLQASVHQSHLKLEFEIRNRPQSANDDEGIFRAGEIHKEAIELLDRYARGLLDSSFNHGNALVRIEKRRFCFILSHGHNERIEELVRTMNNINMPEGNGIEAAGIYGARYSHSIVAGGLLETS